jgi:glycosyltransferase involved in cell wall biosynthesis
VLVPAGDADGLATAVVELARARELAAELGRRAREHVLEAHTWDRNARVVLDALRAQAGELAA